MRVEERVWQALQEDAARLTPPARPTIEELAGRRRRGWPRVAVAAGGVAVLIAVVAVVSVWPGLPAPEIGPVQAPEDAPAPPDTGEVTVPDLEGLTLDEATSALEQADLVGGPVSGDDWSDPNDPDAVVVAQAPPAGSQVPAGEPVGLRTALVSQELCDALDRVAPSGGDARELAGQEGYWDALRRARPHARGPLAGHMDTLLAQRDEEVAVDDMTGRALGSVAIHHRACRMRSVGPTSLPAGPVREFGAGETDGGIAYEGTLRFDDQQVCVGVRTQTADEPSSVEGRGCQPFDHDGDGRTTSVFGVGAEMSLVAVWTPADIDHAIWDLPEGDLEIAAEAAPELHGSVVVAVIDGSAGQDTTVTIYNERGQEVDRIAIHSPDPTAQHGRVEPDPGP